MILAGDSVCGRPEAGLRGLTHKAPSDQRAASVAEWRAWLAKEQTE